LSHDLQLNYVISFFFRLHLVLHACAARFDVTGTVAFFRFSFWVRMPTKQALNVCETISVRPSEGVTRSVDADVEARAVRHPSSLKKP
jgi:hypothetical protein